MAYNSSQLPRKPFCMDHPSQHTSYLSPVTASWSNERKTEWMEITKQKLHRVINHYKNKIKGCPHFPCSDLFNQKHLNLTSTLTRGKPQKVISKFKTISHSNCFRTTEKKTFLRQQWVSSDYRTLIVSRNAPVY